MTIPHDLSLIIIPPATPTHSHTVVCLHGRGDHARSLASSIFYSPDSRKRPLPDTFPSIRWVFPQSETRACEALAGEEIPQWFDICDVSDFTLKEELQAAGLKESVTSIQYVLANEAARLNGRWDRIVLAGISQGGATSVHTLLNLSIPVTLDADGKEVPRRLGALIGFSCTLPFPGRSLVETRQILDIVKQADSCENEIIRNTPVLLEHCLDDEIVKPELGRGLRDTLRRFGADVTWKEYSSGGHWINSPNGVDDVVDFFKHHLLGK